jgi:hypothetical protein
MDERRTLTLLGWSVGGVVGIMFLLNAFALASLAPAAHGGRLMAEAGQPVVTVFSPAAAAKARGS